MGRMKFLVILFLREGEGREDCLLNYKGSTSVTESGRECRRWDTDYPHEPKYTPKDKRHNHCRNPDRDTKGPWCYTTDPAKRFEYCQVTDCNDGTENTCHQPGALGATRWIRTRGTSTVIFPSARIRRITGKT